MSEAAGRCAFPSRDSRQNRDGMFIVHVVLKLSSDLGVRLTCEITDTKKWTDQLFAKKKSGKLHGEKELAEIYRLNLPHTYYLRGYVLGSDYEDRIRLPDVFSVDTLDDCMELHSDDQTYTPNLEWTFHSIVLIKRP